MAKLEDLVTPSEILEMIKGGMLKTELIKRYRDFGTGTGLDAVTTASRGRTY